MRHKFSIRVNLFFRRILFGVVIVPYNVLFIIFLSVWFIVNGCLYGPVRRLKSKRHFIIYPSLWFLKNKGTFLISTRSQCEQEKRPHIDLPTKRFRVVNEGFVCENCQALVSPTTCGTPRNHCPFCLYSKHVDINVGDRANPCKGKMKPIGAISDARKGFIIVHQCMKCRQIKRSKAIPEKDKEPDNFNLIVELSTKPIL